MQDWFILQVNPQCETKAIAELRRAGIRAYLPKAARLYRHHRTKETDVRRRPALVGYVFVRFTGERPDWYGLRRCQGVKGILYSDGRPYQLARNEVAAMMRAQRKFAFDDGHARSYRRAWKPGYSQTKFARESAKVRFQPGSTISAPMGALERILARVTRVTERGTIHAVAEIMGTETPVHFTDISRVELIDVQSKAA